MLRKIFTELRYPVQVDIFDRKGAICKSLWPEYFSHWKSKDYLIKFINNEDEDKATEIFIVTPNRILFSIENLMMNDIFMKKFKKYFKSIKSIINPNYFDRIGVRIWSYDSQINFNKIITNLPNNTIFNKSFLSKYCSKNKINDFSTTFESDKMRIIFGPMKKDEKSQYLDEIVNKDELLDEFMFYDIDCFEKNVDKNEIYITMDKLFIDGNKIPGLLSVNQEV